ncbi:MAG: cytidylyltransferase domain-containing protein, partial [Deltaproteobacteria bacterium]
DEPVLRPEDMDRLVETLKQHPEAQIATLAVRRTDPGELMNPNCVKVVCDDLGRALYFSRQRLASSENGEFLKHIGIYAYRRDSLFEFCRMTPSSLERSEKLEQLRALQNGMKIQVCLIEQDSISVDAPEDIKKVEDYLKKNNLSHGKIGLKEDS